MLPGHVPLSRSGAQWECGEWELTASEQWAVQGGPAQVMGTLNIAGSAQRVGLASSGPGGRDEVPRP